MLLSSSGYFPINIQQKSFQSRTLQLLFLFRCENEVSFESRFHEITVHKMADFDEDEDAFANDDFYAVLNVRKEVSLQKCIF